MSPWLLDKLKTLCADEIAKIQRASSITNASVEAISTFNDQRMCEELDELCPVISNVLKGAVGTHLEGDRERFGHRTLCYAVLFKARYGNSRASVISHRNDQLFIAAGVKKKAFKWFNKMGVTNSYKTALNKHKSFTTNHDEDVLKWKKSIEKNANLDTNADEYEVM